MKIETLLELQPYPAEALNLQDVIGFHDAILHTRLELNLRSREEAYEIVEKLHKHLYGFNKYSSYESCAESCRKKICANRKNPMKLGTISAI